METHRDSASRVKGLPALPASSESWGKYLSGMDIPVLKRTVLNFESMAERKDSLDVRTIADAVLDDPLMTLKVYAWSAKIRNRRQITDIETLEPIILMSGVEPFFRQFRHLHSIEDSLKDYPLALGGLLRVISRSYRAATYARDWALRRRDLDTEVILIAALLHDFVEMIMWVLAPNDCAEMELRKKLDSTLRSADVQHALFGVSFNHLEHALAVRWHLPELIISMLDDQNAEHPSVRNVVYAVNLARHSSRGWDNPALPDDFHDIAGLLNVSVERVKEMIVPQEYRQPTEGTTPA
jgi:HD-like signal output (HDOD) protein